MVSLSFSYKGLIALACIITACRSDNQTIYGMSDSKDLSDQVFNLMKDELQLVNMELTKSFIANHVRKKRSLHYDHELKLALTKGEGFHMSLGVDIGNYMMNGYPLLNMNGETLVMTENGTFRIGLLNEPNSHEHYKPPDNYESPGHGNPIISLPVSSWHPPRGEVILCSIYWRQTLFFLVTTRDRTFSQIYTSAGTGMNFEQPILRQKIKNHGQATAAKFFVHKVNLYLLIANDNPLHSLALCPLFRWEGTYMDEIHNIQTRGTKDIIAFKIEYDTYMILAQSADTAGNSEIGTQVIKMNDNEELEKVQLLWSNDPVALVYFPGFKEHFIIIGQRKEYSICYWFGGFDFVHWQKLDDVFGDRIFFDVLQIKNTKILLAASTTSVKFYTFTILGGRTPTITPLDASFTVAPHQRLLGAKFLSLADGSYYVSMQVADGNKGMGLLVRRLEIDFRQIAASQTREEDSKLKNCLENVKALLDDTKDLIAPINTLSSLVLTKDGAWDYHGDMISHSNVILHAKHSITNTTLIKPQVSISDAAGYLPHEILESASEVNKLFHENNKKLKYVVRKSYPNDINGNIQFSKLDIENFKSHGSSLQVENLNGISSSKLRSDVLRKEAKSPQIVAGVWWMKDLSAKTFETSHWNKEIEANTKRFLQLNNEDHIEIVRSELHFAKNMTFSHDLRIDSQASINGVSFSNLVFRNFDNCHIKGYKKSDFVHGVSKFRPEYVNGVLFPQWMDETIKLTGTTSKQNVTGPKVFDGNFIAENIDLGTVNDLHWKPFTKSVLFKNPYEPQSIEGNINCINLGVGDATVKTANGINVNDLMRNTEHQKINSQVTVRLLRITSKNQAVDFLNQYPFSSYAVLNKTMNIRGPVVLENVQAENVLTNKGVTIGKQDVLSMAMLRKKLVISTTKDASFYVSKDVTAHSLYTGSINSVSLKSIPQAYWSTLKHNSINVSLELSFRKVKVLHKFDTGEFNNLKLPEDFVDSKSDAVISSPLYFPKIVIANKKIMMAENARLNNYDILPMLVENIVRLGKKNKIVGHKIFKDHTLAANDLNVTTINGINVQNDVVLLNSHQSYHFTGKTILHTALAANFHSFSNIAVSNTVNRHYNLKRIVNNTVSHHHDRPIHISSDMIFNGLINVPEMSTKEINGIRFPEDVQSAVFLNREQDFREMIIHGTTIFEKDSGVKLLNNISLEEYLGKVLRKNVPQYINANKEFKNVECHELICPSINSIDLRKLHNLGFSKTRSQNVTSPFMFSHIKSSGDFVTPHFSGIPVEHFAQNEHPMRIHSDVEILGGKNGKSTKSASDMPLKNYVKGLINGHSIKQLAAQLTSFPEHREFGSIHVLGNINWKRDSKSMNSLSYLISHAMRKETPQTATRKTFFKKNVSIKNLKSTDWIGGVNLKHLQDDSKWDNSEMVLEGSKNIFHNLIVDNDLNTNHAWFETVNNEKFSNFVDHLVLKNSSHSSRQMISGTKLFLEPISLGNFHTSGQNVFNEMIAINSSRKPYFAHFLDVEVRNLHPDKRFMHQLHYLLENRVNLKEAQNITGNFSFHSLNAVNCDIQVLNDIISSELLFTNHSKPQYIREENTFEYLTAKGDVITPRINNRNLKYLHENSYHTNEAINFNGPVTFKNKVNVANSLHIQNHSNFDNYNTHRIVEKYTAYLQNSTQNFPVSEEVRQLADYRISSLAKNSSSPVWLEYLRLEHEWAASLSKLRIERFTDNGITILSFYDQRENTNVGLAKGCYCQSVEFLKLDNENVPNKFHRMNCEYAFLLKGQEHSYAFYSGSLSYNSSCSKLNEKKSLLVKFNGDLPNAFNMQTKISEHAIPIANLEIGYVADAKMFSSNGVDYLILAQYYNSIEGKFNAPTIVYAVSKEKLLTTQLITSYGARRLALSNVDGYQLLAIANSFNPDPSSCESHSSIFFWSEKEANFLLLREIKTNAAIVDVAFLSVKTKNSKNQLEFAIFAENVNAALSAVKIYQYDMQFKNFHIYQTINLEWDIRSLHTISISDIHYLIIVTPRGLLFFEFSFEEGFRQVFTVPITGASDVTSFMWHSRLYFGITSKKVSLLAEGVISSPFTAYS